MENGGKDVTPLDLFKPGARTGDKDLIQARLDICNQCEFFRMKTQRCRLCGCFMSLKATLTQASCPAKKW
jgi:hypothetical protein